MGKFQSLRLESRVERELTPQVTNTAGLYDCGLRRDADAERRLSLGFPAWGQRGMRRIGKGKGIPARWESRIEMNSRMERIQKLVMIRTSREEVPQIQRLK